jgi:hypothetical protein
MDLNEEKQNPNPLVFAPTTVSRVQSDLQSLLDHEQELLQQQWYSCGDGGGDVQERDVIDAAEVFELIRHVNDPEHPLTLEQLKVATVSLRDELAGSHVRLCLRKYYTCIYGAMVQALCTRIFRYLKVFSKKYFRAPSSQSVGPASALRASQYSIPVSLATTETYTALLICAQLGLVEVDDGASTVGVRLTHIIRTCSENATAQRG